ncbi:MAG: DUF167 domain-containing protein [Euryarchaeota archaeon]|nr:DUF167 domain-containing protein [Euryarchaeota archaeon]
MKTIEIKVIPNSNVEAVIEAEPLIVRVKEPPTKGKANKAVVKLLSEYFNANVRIVSGTKSRRKIVEIEEKQKDLKRLGMMQQ